MRLTHLIAVALLALLLPQGAQAQDRAGKSYLCQPKMVTIYNGADKIQQRKPDHAVAINIARSTGEDSLGLCKNKGPSSAAERAICALPYQAKVDGENFLFSDDTNVFYGVLPFGSLVIMPNDHFSAVLPSDGGLILMEGSCAAQ